MPNSKKYTPYTVKLNGQPVPAERYTVQSFTRSLGGGKVDNATVIVERAPDLYLGKSSARPLECDVPLEIFYGGTRVFWGLVQDAGFAWGEGPDSKTLIASVQPWVFGPPLAHATYLVVQQRNYLGPTTTRVRVDEPIVFNGFPPGKEEWVTREGKAFVGNKTAGNQWKGLTRDGKDTDSLTSLLIPLEAVQTDVGRERYANTFSPWQRLGDDGLDVRRRRGQLDFEWTLRDAVEYLCVHANDEKWVANPTRKDLEVLPELILPRTEMPASGYLPDFLDKLLPTYGYDWFVDPATEGGQGVQKPVIRFAQYGVGPEVSAKYAAVGKDADFNTTNLLDVSATYSTSQVVNKIHAKGGRVLIEGTWELYRVGEDKWVLNEGGDYRESPFAQYHRGGTLETKMANNEVVAPQPDELAPSDEFGLFGQTGLVRLAQRRRRFLPTITVVGPVEGYGSTESGAVDTRPIGPNRGYDIEVLDLGQGEAAAGAEVWRNINEIEDPIFRHVRVLEDECGIIFDRGQNVDGEAPDEIGENFFLESQDLPRVRVTATIELDFAVQALVERDRPNGVSSVAANEQTYVWQDDERWPCRMRLKSGRYASKYANHPYHAETPSPDQIVADMKRQARALLERMDAAKINGTLVFNNLDEAVPLGGIVKTIAGREFALGTRLSKDAPQHPQIVAVTYQAQEATIIATLTTEPRNAFDAFS